MALTHRKCSKCCYYARFIYNQCIWVLCNLLPIQNVCLSLIMPVESRATNGNYYTTLYYTLTCIYGKNHHYCNVLRLLEQEITSIWDVRNFSWTLLQFFTTSSKRKCSNKNIPVGHWNFWGDFLGLVGSSKSLVIMQKINTDGKKTEIWFFFSCWL